MHPLLLHLQGKIGLKNLSSNQAILLLEDGGGLVGVGVWGGGDKTIQEVEGQGWGPGGLRLKKNPPFHLISDRSNTIVFQYVSYVISWCMNCI